MGAVNECPKKRLARVADQVWSACGNMPIGLGNEVIRRYISEACSRDGGNVSACVGKVPKRNARARGPRHPKGSIAKGRRVMFRWSRSPNHIYESLQTSLYVGIVSKFVPEKKLGAPKIYFRVLYCTAAQPTIIRHVSYLLSIGAPHWLVCNLD